MQTTTQVHAPARAGPIEAILLWRAGLNHPMYESIVKGRAIEELMRERPLHGHGIHELVRMAAFRLGRTKNGREQWHYTGRHSLEVAYYSCLMAMEAKRQGVAGAESLDLPRVFAGGFTHDIGKTFLPMALLAKEWGIALGPMHVLEGMRLSDDERNLLRSEHVAAGVRFVDSFGKWDGAPLVRDMVHYHHVMYDGKSGAYPSYPGGLKGWELPLCARIAKVADFISALGYRHYRRYYGEEGGLQWIGHRVANAVALAGQELCPRAVACFITSIYGGNLAETAGMISRLGRQTDAGSPGETRKYAMETITKDREFAGMTREREAGKLTQDWVEITRCGAEMGAPPLYKLWQ